MHGVYCACLCGYIWQTSKGKLRLVDQSWLNARYSSCVLDDFVGKIKLLGHMLASLLFFT